MPYSSAYSSAIVSPGKLAVLADQEQPRAEPLRQRGGDDEAARLDAGDEVGLVLDPEGEPLDRRGEALRVEQQGGDVAELDARLGKSGMVRISAFRSS